jgi:hypothetical protein
VKLPDLVRSLEEEGLRLVKEGGIYPLLRRMEREELIVDLESHIEGAVSHGKRPEEAICSAKERAMDQAEDCRKPPQWKDRALSWSASILYTSAFAIGIADHRRDPTRPAPIVPAIAKSPGLVPTEEASLRRKRKCDRAGLGFALWPVFWFTVSWALRTIGGL